MPKPETLTGVLDTLTRNLVHLAAIAPEELVAFAVLVDAAVKRHEEEERAKHVALFHRVK